MGMDYTAYEGRSETRTRLMGGFALARIISVDSDNRVCTVQTFYATDPALKDLYIPKVQWLSLDAGGAGDETTCIPRKDSYCLVFFVEGEAFAWGFLSPTKATGAPAGSVKEQANSGDKLLKTVGENFIILRSGGDIEIQSTNLCRTLYLPDSHTISHICRNYEMSCDGGSENWINNAKMILNTKTYRDTLLGLNVLKEEKGFVNTTDFIQETFGVGIPGGIPPADILPMVEKTVTKLGTVTFKVHPPAVPLGFKAEIKPTGAFSVEVGMNQFLLEVSPTGSTNLSINKLCDLEISATGSVSLKVAKGLASIELTPSGNVKISGATGIDLEAKTKVSISALAGADIDAKGPVSISSLGPVSIKGMTLTLDGGSGPSGKPLLFPYARSQFTGLPLMPFSNTITMSP